MAASGESVTRKTSSGLFPDRHVPGPRRPRPHPCEWPWAPQWGGLLSRQRHEWGAGWGSLWAPPSPRTLPTRPRLAPPHHRTPPTLRNEATQAAWEQGERDAFARRLGGAGQADPGGAPSTCPRRALGSADGPTTVGTGPPEEEPPHFFHILSHTRSRTSSEDFRRCSSGLGC